MFAVARNVIWVCRTLSCELRGAHALQKHLETRFECGVNGTSKDGKFTLKTAECLAACGQAPMVQTPAPPAGTPSGPPAPKAS